MSGRRHAGVLFLVLAPADAAHAYTITEIAGAFLQGALQPASKPVHALSLVALGLLLGTRGSFCWPPFLLFAMGLAAGLTAIGLATGATPAAELLLASAALSGVIVASQWAMPRPVPLSIAAVTGAAIGLDSPPAAISIAAANAALVGSGIGSCVALAAAAGSALLVWRDWQRVGLRIVGSWITASAILVLALRFAPLGHLD